MKISLRYVIIVLSIYCLLWTGNLTAQIKDDQPQIIAGVDCFREPIDKQLPLLEDLLAAFKTK